MRKTILLTAIIILFFFNENALADISNQYIDAKVTTFDASFTVSNGSGQDLLYEYENDYTSFATIQIDGNSNTNNYLYYDGNDIDTGNVIQIPQDTSGNTQNNSSWQTGDVLVSQQLSIVPNPRTGRHPDTIQILYTIQNTSTSNPHNIGLRILLDTFLEPNGDATRNDAPNFAEQGYGLVTQDTQWTSPANGGTMGDAWKEFYGPEYPDCEAECGLATGGVFVPKATQPDMLIYGKWFYMQPDSFEWTYILTPAPITDSAAAMYWGPSTYNAGEEHTYFIYFGIPDVSGSDVVVSKGVNKTQNIMYGDTLTYTLTYSDTGTGAVQPTNVYLWDSIPSNTSLVSGQLGYQLSGNVISWSIGSIPNTYTSYSRWFSVSSNPCVGVEVDNSSGINYFDPYWNFNETTYSNTTVTTILTCTVTITPTIVPTETLTYKGVFPNPASIQANFVYGLTAPATVNLTIYDVSGEVVKKISNNINNITNNGTLSSPTVTLESIAWNCDNNSNKKVASGIYIYCIEIDSDKQKIKHWGKVAVVK